MDKTLLRKEILPYIFMRNSKGILFPQDLGRIIEIRVRAGRPIMLLESTREWFISLDGTITSKNINSYIMTPEEVYRSLLIVSQNSIYAYMEDLINGFITLPGGHRVGVVGKTVMENGKIKSFTDISGLNFRVSHELLGSAKKVLPYIIEKCQVLNTLIVSPPACGKTTILRDVARSLSEGVRDLYFPGIKVGIVDERSEICAQNKGKHLYDVGMRTDVLDGCPKYEGIMMLLRTMSPQVIITDEIGSDLDMIAIKRIVNGGVQIIASYHGYGISSVHDRAELRGMVADKVFQRIIVLSGKEGPGTLEEVYDSYNNTVLFKRSICG